MVYHDDSKALAGRNLQGLLCVSLYHVGSLKLIQLTVLLSISQFNERRYGHMERKLTDTKIKKANSLLNELGFNPDAIERQLAHKETNKIRAAYNRAQYRVSGGELRKKWIFKEQNLNVSQREKQVQ
jgi:hypothetical protein